MFTYLRNTLKLDKESLDKYGFEDISDLKYFQFDPSIDPAILYFESIRNNDPIMVTILLYTNSVDVNFRVRMNKVRRTEADIIALREAITAYNFDMAELLIKYGHNTDEFTITFPKENRNNLYYESQKKAIKFCEDHNIKYEEV